MKLRLTDTPLTWRKDIAGVYRAGQWQIRRSGRWWRLTQFGTDLSLPGNFDELQREAQRRENA